MICSRIRSRFPSLLADQLAASHVFFGKFCARRPEALQASHASRIHWKRRLRYLGRPERDHVPECKRVVPWHHQIMNVCGRR